MLVPEKPGTKGVRTFAKQSAAKKGLSEPGAKQCPLIPSPYTGYLWKQEWGFGRFITGFTSCVPGKQTPFSGDLFGIVAHTEAFILFMLVEAKNKKPTLSWLP